MMSRKGELDRLAAVRPIGGGDHSPAVRELMGRYVVVARTCQYVATDAVIGHVCHHPQAIDPPMCLWIDCPRLVMRLAVAGRMVLIRRDDFGKD